MTNPSIYILIFSAVMLFIIQVCAHQMLGHHAWSSSSHPQINSLSELSSLCIVGACFVLLYDGILIYLGAANCVCLLASVCYLHYDDTALYVSCAGAFYGSSGSVAGQNLEPVDKMWSIFNAFGLLLFRCVPLVEMRGQLLPSRCTNR